MKPILQAEKLAKQYRIGGPALRSGSLRESLVEGARRMFRGGRDGEDQTIWALRDVSFEVFPGEAIGIVGNNGAGKSTLLKILSRITAPTSGHVDLYGRVGSLLEVGTGFHSELTGRENIYLNGAILGMKRREIDRKFDEIVDYAGIGEFLDTPVKRYSSGMYMRLAFAVAAHLDPEILLLDEVLAVGDLAFQNKCIGKMEKVAKEGRTVLFVSHNMSAVTRLCKTAFWIEKGRIREHGPAETVISHYMTAQTSVDGLYEAGPDDARARKLTVRRVIVKNGEGATTVTLDARDPFSIEIEYDVHQTVPGGWVGFSLHTSTGIAVLATAEADDERLSTGAREPGRYRAMCTIPANLLNFGRYVLSVQAVERAGNTNVILADFTALSFEVMNTGIASRLTGERIGVVCPLLAWELTRSAGGADVRS